MAINYKSDVSKLQRDLERLFKKMPKVTSTSTKRTLENLKTYVEEYQSEITTTVLKIWAQNNKALQIVNGETVKTKTLSARGWHKDHNNYNKAESWERTPAKRKTPARNVKKK